MKYGYLFIYSKLLYGQRNKDETIVSVIKRLFGEHITSSRMVGKKTEQNRIEQRTIYLLDASPTT